ncbi:MAG TPA: hypothetical protein O0X39_03305 [Methanocorpusculum sp.]|nr:hypothetical protein [Methanocorpusculum sp.]
MHKAAALCILSLLLAAVFASAGCIVESNNNSTYSLNPMAKVGELRGLYLNYVDDKTGDSWWATTKTKVGSSVLSLKGPDIAVSEIELSDEKREILQTALNLCELSMISGQALNLGKSNLFGYEEAGSSIYDYFLPKTIDESSNDVRMWVEYSIQRYPYVGIGKISASELKRIWPVLKDALLDAAE